MDAFNLTDVPKKTQLITLSSWNANSGDVNSCQFLFDNAVSNVYIENKQEVIGIRLLDFQVTLVRSNAYAGTLCTDIEIREVPPVAQIMDSYAGRIFAKVPLNITNDTATGVRQAQAITQHNDFQYDTPPRYFTPIVLDRLTFDVFAIKSGGGSYERVPFDDFGVSPGVSWTIVLEITTIDRDVPKQTPLLDAVKELNESVKRLELGSSCQVQAPKQIEPAPSPIPWKFVSLILILIVVYLAAGLNKPRTNLPTY
jgi:hypothetical protein